MQVVELKPKDETETEEQIKKVRELILKASEDDNTGMVIFTIRKDGSLATHTTGLSAYELALCSVIFPSLVMGQLHAVQGKL